MRKYPLFCAPSAVFHGARAQNRPFCARRACFEGTCAQGGRLCRGPCAKIFNRRHLVHKVQALKFHLVQKGEISSAEGLARLASPRLGGTKDRRRHQPPCREGGAMRRPEGTRRERSEGGMPRWGSCEAAGVESVALYAKKRPHGRHFAERARFELAIPFWGTHAFQACLFSHSSISPIVTAKVVIKFVYLKDF